MATLAQSVPKSQRASRWLWELLREEMTPYPGRVALVARMMIATTIVMIVSMTFRMPEGAYAAIYALTISRGSSRATVGAVKTLAVGFVLAAAYELIGAIFFVNEPSLRLIWVIATFFLMFYLLRSLTNYTAAVRFGYLVVITTPLWDRHVSAVVKVEGTLWAVWAITLSTILTALIELVYGDFSGRDDLIRPIADRLSCVEQVILSYADGHPMDATTEKTITRLAMVGMSELRRTLQRSSYSSQHSEQMGAVLALVSRLVDIAANLAHLNLTLSDAERDRTGNLAQRIAGIRADLEGGSVPHETQLPPQNDAASAVPLLREMEATVSLIPEAFTGSQSLNVYGPSAASDAPRTRLFRQDALSNFEYIKFGLKGCLAASLCYIIYNFIDWPGISTAVTTCFLTALSTIGSSRQKQLLRIAGAIVGGVVLGIGAQIFVLPHLDSIGDFTLLFLGVTFIAAWFATCSARLSYFGIQIAVAFDLVNLQEFKIQTSLAVARDRVFGILLGLFVMWLVFDHLWGAPAVVEMKRTLISNFRLLAQFAREPVSEDRRIAIDRSMTLREKLNTGFDNVRALADGVLFEFGPSREQNLALRARVRQWQTRLRMLFITRIALWKYRMRLPGFALPESIWRAQHDFDDELAQTLDAMANRLEGKQTGVRESTVEACFRHLEHSVQMQREFPVQLETFLTLSHRAEELAISLDQEI